MPVVDLVVFVIIVCAVLFYILMRFGAGRKIGEIAQHEVEVIKEKIEDKKP